ncbi:MAG: methyltransferase domain-containing protein [Methylohalobius sp.]
MKLDFDFSYYSNPRPEILDLIPLSAKRILDVGCGAGNLGAGIKARQEAEVHGIEPFSPVVSYATAHLDKVWNTTVEEAIPELQDEYYDCIILADVLEHLLDPWKVLTYIKQKLKKDGIIISSIPNIQHSEIIFDLIEGDWNYKKAGILDQSHLRFFTNKTIKQLFWNSGLVILSIKERKNNAIANKILLSSLKKINLDIESIAKHGDTVQFLVTAARPESAPLPQVAIIILNWNGKNDTLECLNSIRSINYPKSNFEILVVDNGSTDNSVLEISKEFPEVNIIETGKNLGYTGGNNVGISWALSRKSDYILILNNDTIVDPNILNAFVSCSRLIPEAGIFGAKISFYSNPDTLYHTGMKWKPSYPGFELLGYGVKDNVFLDRISEVNCLSGCALFIKSEVIKKVGLFDERFFLAFGDVDLCYTANAKGFKCIYVPEAKVLHKVSASFGKERSPMAIYFWTRNFFLWSEKHLELPTRLIFMLRMFAKIRRSILPTFVIPKPFGIRRLYWETISYYKKVIKNLPIAKSRLMAVRDYFLRRFYDCPDYVRFINKQWCEQQKNISDLEKA